jgi:uncharacterized membrane protein YdbT with pleckstrin-like domain
MSYADGLLAKDEEILLREHQHWIFPFYIAGKWVAIAAIVTLIGFVLSQFVFRSDGTGIIGGAISLIDQVVWIVTLIALAIAVIGFVYSIIQWQTQEYLLTDHRVLHVHGVINKQSGDSSLENITDAQINVPWLGRLLGFGDLVVMTASEAGINNLRALRDPINFKKGMMDAKTQRMVLLNTPRAAAPAPAPEPAPVPAPAPAPAPNPVDTADEVTRTLASLATLRDSGAITPEEYEAKKTELLGRI